MAQNPLLERPAVRWGLLAVGGAVLVLAAAYALLVGFQRGQGDRVLAGVQVEGESVGGASRSELVTTVDARTEARLADPVVVVASEGDLETDRAGVGASVDRATTVDAAWDRGRRGFLRALWDHLRARMGGTVEIGGEDETVDVEVTEPREGREVDPEPLREEVAGQAERPGEVRIEVRRARGPRPSPTRTWTPRCHGPSSPSRRGSR